MLCLQLSMRVRMVARMYVCGVACAVPMAYLFAFTLHQGLPGLWEGWLLGYSFVLGCNLFFVGQSDWPGLAKSAKVRSEMRSLSSAVGGTTTLSALREALLVRPSCAM